MTFSQIEKIAAAAPITCSAGEIHGIICGVLVNDVSFSFEAYLRKMAELHPRTDDLSDEQIRVLRVLFTDTAECLQTGDSDFQLLLPDAEASYADRTRAMGAWYEGFMHGIAMNAVTPISEMSDHRQIFISAASELIEGIKNASGQTDPVAAEQAYVLILKYLNVSVVSLCDDVQEAHEQQPDD